MNFDPVAFVAAVTAETSGPGAPSPRERKPPSGDARPPQREGPRTEQVREASEWLATYLRSIGRHLEFRVDDASGRVVVVVTDAQTGEQIRQIPGEETLRLARRQPAADASALLDTKA